MFVSIYDTFDMEFRMILQNVRRRAVGSLLMNIYPSNIITTVFCA